MFDKTQLKHENAALIALVRTCRKPDTWTSLANLCVMEGSAERVLRNRVDPEHNPLKIDEDDSSPVQGELIADLVPDNEYAYALQKEQEAALDELDKWKTENLNFVSIFDSRFPVRLKSTIDVPPFLFADGMVSPQDRGVSVVGSRNCAPEGVDFAKECAEMLVDRGLSVIAGLAKGIDTVAHSVALSCGGRTVAFIGTGIRRCYPTENRDLQQSIAKRGLVLSQFWPDAAPSKQSFPMRNALMSGYGIATIVADAGEYSGTRIQVRQAQRHGRPVIINRMVLDKAKWARDLKGKPGIYVVDGIDGAERALDLILGIENGADELIEMIMREETVLV